MTSQVWWYVARASGLVAAALLAATLIWGLLITTHVIDRRGMAAWLTDLHRGLGALTVVLIGVHLGSLVADSYLHFSWTELFVPFASTYRAGAVAWGVIALWGLVLVEGSSLVIRRRKTSRWWRRIHFLSFPVGAFVGVHLLTAGSDTSSTPFRVVAIGVVGALSYLVLRRVLDRGRRTATSTRTSPLPRAAMPDGSTRPPVPTAPITVSGNQLPPPIPSWAAAGPTTGTDAD